MKTSIQTWEQDERCQKIREQRKIKLARKKVSRKRRKKSVLRKKLLMHHLKVILMLLLKKISTEIVHANVLVNAMNYEVSSTLLKLSHKLKLFLKQFYQKYLSWMATWWAWNKETKGTTVFLRKKNSIK